jgi:hypothetical protein
LPLPSDGYNLSKARTSSMADLPLLRKFPLCLCIRFFVLDVLAHILIFGSVQHLYASSIYVLRLPAPPPFFYCIPFLRNSLFSSHVHPYVLSICYIFGGLSIWRAISIWRAPSSFSPPSSFWPPCSFLSFSEDSMISLTNATSCVKNWPN